VPAAVRARHIVLAHWLAVSQVAPAGRASSPTGGGPEQSDAFDAWICASAAWPAPVLRIEMRSYWK